jgi:filamentous hemagglutinin
VPKKNANAEMIRSIERQNEAGKTLSEYGLDVEYLPDSNKAKSPDLRINGVVADVYSPSGNSVLTVRTTIETKTASQAQNVVLNLADSSLSISDVVQYLQRNPVPKLESLIVIKDGKVVVFK